MADHLQIDKFADLIRRRMDAMRITAAELARAIVVVGSEISYYRRGIRAPRTPLMVRRVCQTLHIADEHAWAMVLTGQLPMPVTFEQAVRIAELCGWQENARVGSRPLQKATVAHCLRCNYSWRRRLETRPPSCPKCSSSIWDVAKPTPTQLKRAVGVSRAKRARKAERVAA